MGIKINQTRPCWGLDKMNRVKITLIGLKPKDKKWGYQPYWVKIKSGQETGLKLTKDKTLLSNPDKCWAFLPTFRSGQGVKLIILGFKSIRTRVWLFYQLIDPEKG